MVERTDPRTGGNATLTAAEEPVLRLGWLQSGGELDLAALRGLWTSVALRSATHLDQPAASART
jgi:hypothetical protein